ncbi:MAG: hypothetical protein C4346_02195 [Chloroflexota bacterium]
MLADCPASSRIVSRWGSVKQWWPPQSRSKILAKLPIAARVERAVRYRCLQSLTAFGNEMSSMQETIEARPGGSRRERLRAQMRREILDAARRIVQEHGIERLSMRTLASAVGVHAPTLYAYFASKDAVLDALYLEGAERLHTAFQEANEASPPGRARLQALAKAYRDFARSDPDLFQLIFGRVEAAYRPSEAVVPRAAALFGVLLEEVKAAIAIGELREADPVEVAIATWSMAQGFVTLEVNGFLAKCQPLPTDILYQRCLDLLYVGIQPAGQAAGEPPEAPEPQSTGAQ